MILIDANVFMYAAGAPHPHKLPSSDFLRRVGAGEVDACADAEVLQEILHRYRSIGRWTDGATLYDLVRRIVPTVVPITADIVDEARVLLERHSMLLARDALHAAVAIRLRADAICSYDQDFDRIPGLRRVTPEHA